jgi:hypothetical protein
MSNSRPKYLENIQYHHPAKSVHIGLVWLSSIAGPGGVKLSDLLEFMLFKQFFLSQQYSMQRLPNSKFEAKPLKYICHILLSQLFASIGEKLCELI